MQFTITPYKRILKTHLDCGIPYEEMMKLLNDETWEGHPGYAGTIQLNRKWCPKQKLKSPKLIEILNLLESKQVAKQILETQYNLNPTVFHKWSLSLEEMYKQTKTVCHLMIESPGANIGTHLDPISLIFTGMTMLTKEDNELCSTKFYDNPDKENLFRSTTNYGDGWIQANLHDTWHEGGNYTDQDRICIIIFIYPYMTKNPNR